VNRLLGDENQQQFSSLLKRLGATAQSIDQLALSLNHTVTTGVDPALAQLPQLLEESRRTLQALRAAGERTAQAAQEAGDVARALRAPDGLLHDLGQGTRRLSEVADRFGRTSLPQLDRAADATTQAARGLGRLASGVSENPQGLLYGAPRISPGPGEPGFVVPPAGHSGEHP